MVKVEHKIEVNLSGCVIRRTIGIMETESVRIAKLKGADDWSMWRFQVKVLVQSAEALELVTGKFVKPARTQGADAATIARIDDQITKWNKADNVAQKHIATNVTEEPLSHIMNCDTSKSMWEKLHSVYEQKSETSVHMLQQQFYK